MADLERDRDIKAVLASARTVAVLGAHCDEPKPACYVPEYLHEQGYRILPVNPRFVGEELWGEPVRATLRELAEPVDIVDVFRRSEAVPEHVDDILAMRPKPKVVWLQLDIRNDQAARRLEAAGIQVVQDRCTLAEHRRLGVGPITPK